MKKLAVVIAVMVVIAMVSGAEAGKLGTWKPGEGNSYYFLTINNGGVWYEGCFDPPYCMCNPELEFNPQTKTAKFKNYYYDDDNCYFISSTTIFLGDNMISVDEWVPSPATSARIKELRKLHEERKKGPVKQP